MTLKTDIASELDSVFFNADEFGTIATTTGGADIPGIFFSEYYAAQPGGDVGIQSSTPVFRAAVASATGVTLGTVLTIDGTDYQVVEPKPDDSGAVDFRLMLV